VVPEAVEKWGKSPLAMAKMHGHGLAYCLATLAGVRTWL